MPRGAGIDNVMKQKIVDAHNNGHSASAISEILGVGRTAVCNIIKKYLSTGIVEKQRRTISKPTKLDASQKEQIIQWVDENCTISLRNIVSKCLSECNITVSKSTIATILSSFSYSLKRIHLVPERRNDDANIEQRYQYARQFISPRSQFSENEIIFIDEVGLNISLRASRGRSIVGSPAVLTVPVLRSRNVSVCCGINRTGIVLYESSTTAYNSIKYCGFLNNLIDVLRRDGRDNFLFVMDNVRFHKTQEVRTLIESSGFAYLYLPPYSPFLNPIENMFSKWKDYIKRASPNNEAELMSLIENGSSLITGNDIAGYFRNMHKYIDKSLNKEAITD